MRAYGCLKNYLNVIKVVFLRVDGMVNFRWKRLAVTSNLMTKKPRFSRYEKACQSGWKGGRYGEPWLAGQEWSGWMRRGGDVSTSGVVLIQRQGQLLLPNCAYFHPLHQACATTCRVLPLVVSILDGIQRVKASALYGMVFAAFFT